jgi:hypothetical protein
MIGKIIDSELGKLVDMRTMLKPTLDQLGSDAAIMEFAKITIPSISWNHAKVVAVNGHTSMTGGGIFLDKYVDNRFEISDLQSKVTGEAAISTHSYCDYFWRYVMPTILISKAY